MNTGHTHKVKITILINQKPFHFEKETLIPEDFRSAVNAPSDYEVWLIVHRVWVANEQQIMMRQRI